MPEQDRTLGALAGVIPAIVANGILSSSGVSATCCMPCADWTMLLPKAASAELSPAA